LVRATFDTFNADDDQITSFGVFSKNSTVFPGTVNVFVVAAPTKVDMLTTIEFVVSLQILTQLAELILEAAPAVVGEANSDPINLVLCIILILFCNNYLLIN
jgi:hypothetical protein